MSEQLSRPDADPVSETTRAVIVGGGRVGAALADRLADDHDAVTVVEADSLTAGAIDADGYEVVEGSGADVDTLEDAGIADADVLAVVTGDDQTNLLVAEIAIERYDVSTVLARCNNPAYVSSFEDLGIRVVSPPVACAQRVFEEVVEPDEGYPQPATDSDVTGDDALRKVTIDVTEELAEGNDIGDVVPEEVVVQRIERDEGDISRPDVHTELRQGDRLIVYGPESMVTELEERL